MNKNIYSIITLCLLLVGMNYINAWTGPATSPSPTNAPNNNVAAPINMGASPQVKTGDLGAADFIADSVFSTGVVSTIDQMNSPLYCDETGTICTSGASLGGAASCTPELSTVNGTVCFTAPTCPAGTVKVDTRTVSMPWCPGDATDITYDVDCLALSCS